MQLSVIRWQLRIRWGNSIIMALNSSSLSWLISCSNFILSKLEERRYLKCNYGEKQWRLETNRLLAIQKTIVDILVHHPLTSSDWNTRRIGVIPLHHKKNIPWRELSVCRLHIPARFHYPAILFPPIFTFLPPFSRQKEKKQQKFRYKYIDKSLGKMMANGYYGTNGLNTTKGWQIRKREQFSKWYIVKGRERNGWKGKISCGNVLAGTCMRENIGDVFFGREVFQAVYILWWWSGTYLKNKIQ